MIVNLHEIMNNGKALFLAYDQGLEHGPVEFNETNVDPQHILNIAEKGGYNGVIFQKGIAEKYYNPNKNTVPLILKLNGKTRIRKGEPFSPQICTVEEAIKLGASAVGYTIYVGSAHEAEMFKEFSKIQREAHSRRIPVIAWIYPRGEAVPNDIDNEILAYGARIGLELGADIIKMKYNDDPGHFKWMAKCTGRAKLVAAGGSKHEEKEVLEEAKSVIDNGGVGLAIGRNIWQHDQPLKITEALKEIIFNGKSVEEAMSKLK